MKVFYSAPYCNFSLFYYIKIHLPNVDKKLNQENITLKWKLKFKIYDKFEGKNTCSCVSVYHKIL